MRFGEGLFLAAFVVVVGFDAAFEGRFQIVNARAVGRRDGDDFHLIAREAPSAAQRGN